MLKSYIRTVTSFGEWPPSHYLKSQMEDWAWTLTSQVLKDYPGNTLFKDAYEELTKASSAPLCQRFLHYVGSLYSSCFCYCSIPR